MRGKLSVLTAALLLIALTGASATKKKSAPEEERWVDTNLGLRLRKGPGVKTETLLHVPYGYRFTVQKRLPQIVTVDGFQGRWVRTNIFGMDGWLFDYYSKPLPPLKKTKQAPPYFRGCWTNPLKTVQYNVQSGVIHYGVHGFGRLWSCKITRTESFGVNHTIYCETTEYINIIQILKRNRTRVNGDFGPLSQTACGLKKDPPDF